MTSRCLRAAVQAEGRLAASLRAICSITFVDTVLADALSECISVEQHVRADCQRSQQRQFGAREAQHATDRDIVNVVADCARTAATWRSSPSINDVRSRPAISSFCRPSSGVRNATFRGHASASMTYKPVGAIGRWSMFPRLPGMRRSCSTTAGASAVRSSSSAPTDS